MLFSLINKKCVSKARLEGKTAIVTGSNSGIGRETAKQLCSRGCRVIMACRDIQNAEQVRREILRELQGEKGIGQLVIRFIDLSSLESVRAFAEGTNVEETHINILVNNAGICVGPESKTADGFESHFGVNHLSHYLLTLLLLPTINKSGSGRIVNVSSMAYIFGALHFEDLNRVSGYNAWEAYTTSKLANILFTKELAKRLEGTNVTVYAAHPGLVNTNATRHFDSTIFKGSKRFYNLLSAVFGKNIQQSADTIIHCAVDEQAGKESGLYYADCGPRWTTAKARNMENAKRLWLISWKLVKLGDFDPFIGVCK